MFFFPVTANSKFNLLKNVHNIKDSLERGDLEDAILQASFLEVYCSLTMGDPLEPIPPFPHFQTLLESLNFKLKSKLISESIMIFIRQAEPNSDGVTVIPANLTDLKKKLNSIILNSLRLAHLFNFLQQIWHETNVNNSMPKQYSIIKVLTNCRGRPTFWPVTANALVNKISIAQYNRLIQIVLLFNKKELTLLCEKLFSDMNPINKKAAQELAPKHLDMFQLGQLQYFIEATNQYKEKYNKEQNNYTDQTNLDLISKSTLG